MRLMAPWAVLFTVMTLLSCQGDAETPAGSVQGTVSSADGIDIHFNAEGIGEPTLVFVHCWCCDATYWDDQVKHFSKTHRVVTVDLAGHGASDLGRKQWTMKAFAADVGAVVKHLALEDVILIGHSMGGPVVVEVALMMPKRIRGLVGIDTIQRLTIDIPPEQLDYFLKQFGADFPGTAEPWVRSMFPENADSVLVSEIAKDMASGPPEVGIGAITEVLRWYRGEAEEALSALDVPFFSINADRQPTDVEILERLVPGYKLRLMPGRGHFLQLEDPETFNRLLEETVAELLMETNN